MVGSALQMETQLEAWKSWGNLWTSVALLMLTLRWGELVRWCWGWMGSLSQEERAPQEAAGGSCH